VAADLADEVLVHRIGHVVHGRAVAEVRVLDDAEALEGVEVPVDGGDVHLGVRSLDPGQQLLGGGVAVGVEQCGDQSPAGHRDPLPRGADAGQDLVQAAPPVTRRRHPAPAAGHLQMLPVRMWASGRRAGTLAAWTSSGW
jgi:hypothetical protein